MIIGVDAGCLGVRDKTLKTGVYTVAKEILKRISQLDKYNEYLLYSFYPISYDITKYFGPNIQNIVIKPHKFWFNIGLSWKFFTKKHDVFFGFSQALPLYHPKKSIVLVHDIAFVIFPDCYKDTYKRLSLLTKFTVKHAKKIITVSDTTKRDLIKKYGIDKAKISVIHNGIDPGFKPAPSDSVKQTLEKYRVKQPYFLFVGSVKPIKNVPTLLKAYAIYRKNSKNPIKLVLAGSNYWEEKEIRDIIKDLSLDWHVIRLGYVDDSDLPGLYSGAVAFVSPSLYEGFGLPILEAIACGTPVITSDRGSIPEIVEDAAIIVDPLDTEDISRALIKVATNRKLASSLRKKGIKQAKMFNWDIAAKKYINIIKKI